MSQHLIDKEIPLPAQIKDVLGILDESGFFEDGLLVGSWVFPFYKEVFGIEYVLRTDDVDFALLPDGYNIGINDGEAAGHPSARSITKWLLAQGNCDATRREPVERLHIHLIPRYKGDTEDPRGGVR